MTTTTLRTLARLAFVLLAAQLTGCDCSPDTAVNPDCENGLQESAALTVQASLEGIRPLGADKDIQIRGNRLSADPCLEANAQSAFSVRIQGSGIVTESVTDLAPGSWNLAVAALSGGSHEPLEQVVLLTANGTLNMTLTPDADGAMVLQ